MALHSTRLWYGIFALMWRYCSGSLEKPGFDWGKTVSLGEKPGFWLSSYCFCSDGSITEVTNGDET
jgi:hypothetical protein